MSEDDFQEHVHLASSCISKDVSPFSGSQATSSPLRIVNGTSEALEVDLDPDSISFHDIRHDSHEGRKDGLWEE